MALEKPTYRLTHPAMLANGDVEHFQQVDYHYGTTDTTLHTRVKMWYIDQLAGFSISRTIGGAASTTITSNTENTITTAAPISWNDGDQFTIDEVYIRSGLYRLRYDSGSMDYDNIGKFQVNRRSGGGSSSSSSSGGGYDPEEVIDHYGFKIVSNSINYNCPGG